MSVTYKWTIERMDCFPQAQGNVNVVFTVFWRAEATDGTHISSVFGSQMVEFDPNDSFTPYENLTQEQVVGWVRSAMGFNRPEDIEFNLAKAVETLANPPVISPPLPWVE